ncbi:hypothetical protein HAX54_001894, partial [Datura stramonium]|nr:hypothetical protein [Datura stramonium]
MSLVVSLQLDLSSKQRASNDSLENPMGCTEWQLNGVQKMPKKYQVSDDERYDESLLQGTTHPIHRRLENPKSIKNFPGSNEWSNRSLFH